MKMVYGRYNFTSDGYIIKAVTNGFDKTLLYILLLLCKPDSRLCVSIIYRIKNGKQLNGAEFAYMDPSWRGRVGKGPS